MKLTLHGHDDRYAVEQLQLSLFPDNTEGEAVSSLHRGKVWLTAVTKITVNGTTAAANAFGIGVTIVENIYPNPKITVPEDIARAEFILGRAEK